MKVTILALCDYATIYSGRLCITGAFDQVRFAKYPVTIHSAVIVAKIQLEAGDNGHHTIQAAIIDQDGKSIASPPESKLDANLPLKMGLKGLKVHHHFEYCSSLRIPKSGEYTLELRIDGVAVASTVFLAAEPMTR